MRRLRRINSWTPPHPGDASALAPLAKHMMAPPSCFVVSGIFSLSDGNRSTEQRHYVDYLSAINFIPDPDEFLNVSVRKYTALAESLHGDHTLVFMVAKGALPVADEGMLDTIYCAPLESTSDDDLLHGAATHVAHVAGTVTSVSNNDMATKSFTLSVVEYVRGERRTFPVMFVCDHSLIPFPLICRASRIQYEGTSNRWRNTPVPSVGSAIIASGTFKAISEGICVLNLLDISFGTAEMAVVTPSSSPTRSIGYRKRSGR